MKLEDADAHNIRSIYIKGKEEEQLFYSPFFFVPSNFHVGLWNLRRRVTGDIQGEDLSLTTKVRA